MMGTTLAAAEARHSRTSSALEQLLATLSEHAVKAVLILGPGPTSNFSEREVVGVYPERFRAAAIALAKSNAFGLRWVEGQEPLVAWKNFSDVAEAEGWIGHWTELGIRAAVRADIPYTRSGGFECFMFVARPITDKAQASLVGWATYSAWPRVSAEIVDTVYGISAREREALRVIAQGNSAREAAAILNCTERTVNWHVGNAKGKLKADNTAQLIMRACSLGII